MNIVLPINIFGWMVTFFFRKDIACSSFDACYIGVFPKAELKTKRPFLN